MAQGTWVEFVAELATRWDVIERLMADHRPNAAGLCLECTTPGRGTPRTEWPCALWALADAARQVRVQQKLQHWPPGAGWPGGT